MTQFGRGVGWCLLFVVIEAVQAVYLGAVFQRVDSLLIGTLVFGITTIVALAATAVFRTHELQAAFENRRTVSIINLFAAVAWGAYFFAVQLIEPAVVFAVFSGAVPLTTLAAAKLRLPEAGRVAGRASVVGYGLIAISLAFLAAATIMDMSGFVRGNSAVASVGVLLSGLSGALTTLVILFSIRLNAVGVGPFAQFGLRFLLYVPLAGTGFYLGLDSKVVAIPVWDLVGIVFLGLAIIAFPLYAVQRAVPLVSAATIASITALGPVLVFGLQWFDPRVEYATATLVGLAIYLTGALIAAIGIPAGSNEVSELKV